MTTEQITGEVALVEGNRLIVKLAPQGYFRYFDIPPGRQFIIDGQPKLISDLRPGTVLTATATTTTQPVTVRTTSVINGTVCTCLATTWFSSSQAARTENTSFPRRSGSLSKAGRPQSPI